MHSDAGTRHRWKPRCISFSGGGVKSIGQMGVMIRLMEEDLLSDVREWYGTSGGSIAAIVGALGVSIGWLRTCVEYFDTHPMLDIQEHLILRFMSEWGVDSGNHLTEYIGKFMDTWEPGSSTWTFAQLSDARPGIFLGIPSVNLSTGEYVLFSVNTHPHMKLVDAVRASSSIPLFYKPWKDADDHIYCDGALHEHYPWICIPKEKHDSTLLIACHNNQVFSPISAPIHTLSEYLSRIFYYFCHTHLYGNEKPRHRIIINSERLGTLDFFQQKEDRLSIIQDGIAAADVWITQHSAQETSESHPSSDLPGTVSSDPMTGPTRAWDSPQSQIPQPPLAHPPDLQSASPPISRRWSL